MAQEVESFFRDIELSEITISRPLGYPGVWRLKRIFRFMKKYAPDIRYQMLPAHIRLFVPNASISVKPWDLVYVRHPLFEIEIFWWKDNKDRMLTGIDITSEYYRIQLLFYGFVEFEISENDEVVLDITPESKVWVIR